MYKAFQIEWYKHKRTKLWLIATLLPLMAVFPGRMFALSMEGNMGGEELWKTLYVGSISQYSALIFPITITIVTALIARMEHQNNSWKHLLALPIRREDVYFSKLLLGMLILLYSTLVFSAGMIMAGFTIGTKGSIPYDLLILRPILGLIASFPIIGLQFFISFRFAHFGIPLACGIGLALPSMLVANSAKYWIFYPWTYPIVTTMSEMFGLGGKATVMYLICCVSLVGFTLSGLIQFRTRDIL